MAAKVGFERDMDMREDGGKDAKGLTECFWDDKGLNLEAEEEEEWEE